jgi:hypothetical protein
MTDIQGIVVPGFLKPHQTLLGIAAGNTTSAAADLKKFISDFSALVSTPKNRSCQEALDWDRVYLPRFDKDHARGGKPAQ